VQKHKILREDKKKNKGGKEKIIRGAKKMPAPSEDSTGKITNLNL
jgi:hypothetical protein